jgi:hypothetical protein
VSAGQFLAGALRIRFWKMKKITATGMDSKKLRMMNTPAASTSSGRIMPG